MKKEDKKYFVYVHIFPNDKKYFGITSKKRPNARWEGGTGYSKEHQPVMYNAIQKYGWENVEHIILYENLTYEEAQEKEMKFIELYKTNCRKYGDAYGYNMTDGGDGTKGHIVSKEVSEKMRQHMLGRKGKLCPNSKIVVCDGIEYDSLTEFKEKFHPKGAINAWLHGEKAMPKKWYDKKLYYKDLGFDIIKCQKADWSNKILCDGIEFESQAKCAQYLKVQPATLCRWIKENKTPKEILDRGFKIIKL